MSLTVEVHTGLLYISAADAMCFVNFSNNNKECLFSSPLTRYQTLLQK